jgi:hypothetical protein
VPAEYERGGYLSRAVALVQEEIKTILAGKSFAMAIDGGSSRLVDGARATAICAVGPLLPFDILMHMDVRPVHESAKSQAAACEGSRKLYDVPKENILFLVGNNSSINKATVTELLGQPYEWDVEHINCLPHCLNLALVSFLEPFEDRFQIAQFMRGLRSFLIKGGSSARNSLARQRAATLSRIGFGETRWDGFLRAVIYMTRVECKYELAAARESLARAARAGVEGAAEGLKERDGPQCVFDAYYEVVEHILEDLPAFDNGAELAPGDWLLTYMADVSNYAAFQLVSKFMDGLPSLFKLIQGGSQWAARLMDDEANVLPIAVDGIRGLLSSLRGLEADGSEEETIDEVMAECERHQLEMDARAVECNQQPQLEGAALEARLQLHADNRAAARAQLVATMAAARARLTKAAALPKLEEALAAQDVRARFDISVEPPNLPPVGPTNAAMYEFLGVPARLRSVTYAAHLRQQWAAHQAVWRTRPVPTATVPPATVAAYYQALAQPLEPTGGAPELGALGLRHWSRPVSFASPERVYSDLTQLDNADNQQGMKGDVLRDTLFLRANWRVMELLKDRVVNRALAAEIEAAGIGGGGTARAQVKRARYEDAARAAVAAAMGAAGGAGGDDL